MYLWLLCKSSFVILAESKLPTTARPTGGRIEDWMDGGKRKEWMDRHKNGETQGYMRQKSDAICGKSGDPKKTVGKRNEVVNWKLSSWRFIQACTVWAFLVKGSKKKKAQDDSAEKRALDWGTFCQLDLKRGLWPTPTVIINASFYSLLMHLFTVTARI